MRIPSDHMALGARLSFPLTRFPEGQVDLRFSRSFQHPPLDHDREALWLDLQSVPGLISIVLNGRELVREVNPGHVESFSLGIDLPLRNQLVLQVDPSVRPEHPWGVVALVIRQKESFDQPDPS